MPLVSRKGILAIAAVIDIAVHADVRPVSAKVLAERHQLPARHLEPVLQALVHDGILKGVRGPHGGYALARERNCISAGDILHAAAAAEEPSDPPLPPSRLIGEVVAPALAEAQRGFSAALSRISVEDMVRQVEEFE
jgi:Rrf2 family protein